MEENNEEEEVRKGPARQAKARAAPLCFLKGGAEFVRLVLLLDYSNT